MHNPEEQRLRNKLLELEQRIGDAGHRSPGLVNNGVAAFCGRVIDGGAKPNAVDRYYYLEPMKPIAGPPSEGETPSLAYLSRRVLVAVVGERVPAVGDVLCARHLGRRWVAGSSGRKLGGCDHSLSETLLLDSRWYGDWTLTWDDTIPGWQGCKTVTIGAHDVGAGEDAVHCSGATVAWTYRLTYAEGGTPQLSFRYFSDGTLCPAASGCGGATNVITPMGGGIARTAFSCGPPFTARFTHLASNHHYPPAGLTPPLSDLDDLDISEIL